MPDKHLPTEEEIMMDIYYYEKELESKSLREEEKEALLEKIKEAEDLYKQIKNQS